MIVVRSANIKSNNILAKLARGGYGVGGTFMHLAVAIVFWVVLLVFLLGQFSSDSTWLGYLMLAAMFFYGIYLTNIGLGFWRLAGALSVKPAALLLKLLAVGCVVMSVWEVLNGLLSVFALVFM
ncbi:hypothetical protein JHU04_003257 [Brenneria sp. 4F2]|nr:hypothetical protein [Brenneria bubanii]